MSFEDRNFFESESEKELEPLEGLSEEEEEIRSVVSEEPAYLEFDHNNQTLSDEEVVSVYLTEEEDRKPTPEEKVAWEAKRQREEEEIEETISKYPKIKVKEEPIEVPSLIPIPRYHWSEFSKEINDYVREEAQVRREAFHPYYLSGLDFEDSVAQQEYHRISQFGLRPDPYIKYEVDLNKKLDYKIKWYSGSGQVTLLPTLIFKGNFPKELLPHIIEYAGVKPFELFRKDFEWGCVNCREKGVITRVTWFYGCPVCDVKKLKRVDSWELPWIKCERTDHKWFESNFYAERPRVYVCRFPEEAIRIYIFLSTLKRKTNAWGRQFSPEQWGFYKFPFPDSKEQWVAAEESETEEED